MTQDVQFLDQGPDLLSTIGNTPVVVLDRLFPEPEVRVLAKLELSNPSGSIKDRIVRHIVEDGERTGKLGSGGTIVEHTSGNTGAAAAMVGALKGYRVILTMPDKVSKEKQAALRAYGAEVIVCPVEAEPQSPDHYVQRARDIAADTPGSFMINQYDNSKNTEAHYLTTGPEIWKQAEGSIDYFVTSGSTGGTVCGVGRYLKERDPDIRVVMPDPVGSVYRTYYETGEVDPAEIAPYQVEGIGEDHIAGCMDFSLIDRMLSFEDEDAFEAARQLARTEAILGGGSSGANIWGCQQVLELAPRPVTIATIICDNGLKYLSKFYDEEWTRRHAKA